MCQVSAKRGVCKNKDINQKFMDNGDDSDQDEIDYFEDYFENYYDQDNADITLCPQCGCNGIVNNDALIQFFLINS